MIHFSFLPLYIALHQKVNFKILKTLLILLIASFLFTLNTKKKKKSSPFSMRLSKFVLSTFWKKLTSVIISFCHVIYDNNNHHHFSLLPHPKLEYLSSDGLNPSPAPPKDLLFLFLFPWFKTISTRLTPFVITKHVWILVFHIRTSFFDQRRSIFKFLWQQRYSLPLYQVFCCCCCYWCRNIQYC